jgi:hypothetical protein
MADHRYTDSETESAGTEQQDIDPNRSPGMMWGWVAAIFAVVMIMALTIGFNPSGNVANNVPPAIPTTTGSALPTAPRARPSLNLDLTPAQRDTSGNGATPAAPLSTQEPK